MCNDLFLYSMVQRYEMLSDKTATDSLPYISQF